MLWLAVYSVALNEAERRVDAGTAAMLVNTGPILIAIFAGIFLREGFPPGLFAGCGVAFSGVVLIAFATSQSGARSGLGSSSARRGVRLRRRRRHPEARARARVAVPGDVARLAAATIACLPFAPTLVTEPPGRCRDDRLDRLSRPVPTALGFATYAFALRRMTAGRLASLTYLTPPVAVVLGWAVLGEAPPSLALPAARCASPASPSPDPVPGCERLDLDRTASSR